MKSFCIQTTNDEITHDFSFSLIEAIKYNNWYNNKIVYEYILSENAGVTNCIPVGSVEFVLDTLHLSYNIDVNSVRPLNIPQELIKPEYLKRWIKIVKTDSNTINTGDTPIFVKDNTKIKGWTNIVDKNQGFPAGEYLVSEYIDIDSEWRAFVFNKRLVGLQNYLGDFTVFPDVKLIKNMINDYSNIGTYTLDVGINKNDTFIIECHDFFSCGLYGFADYKLLPLMFINTWNKLIRLKREIIK